MKTLNDISSEGILSLTKKRMAVCGVDVYFVDDLAWLYTGLGPIFYKAKDIELLHAFVTDSISTGMYRAEYGKMVWDGPETMTETLALVNGRAQI